MDLSHTIVPKSDQLNADDLIAGNITITVTDIKASDSPDQPVIIHYENDNGRPYKPCKSMRRVLIQAWGANGKQWIGKSMTLYRDPDVKFDVTIRSNAASKFGADFFSFGGVSFATLSTTSFFTEYAARLARVTVSMKFMSRSISDRWLMRIPPTA